MRLSQDEKLKFIHSIPTEEVLREGILMPVFQQMKQAGKLDEVYLTHGNDEKGRDIVLAERTSIDDLMYTAVIVKNTPISNSTSSKDKECIANLENQITMALGAGYPCKVKKEQVNFGQVLVVTSKSISHGAKEHLLQFIKKSPHVLFALKEDNDLVRWIDSYLPELYYSGAALSGYLSALRQRCEKLNELRNISFYRGEIRALLDVYVPPTLKRFQRKENGDGTYRSVPVYEQLEKVLLAKGNMIITAGAGSGKSTVIRAQIQRLIAAACSGSTLRPFPVFARAADLFQLRDAGALEDMIQEYVRKDYGVTGFEIRPFLDPQAYHAYVFIDALDELPNVAERDDLRERIVHFTKAYPKAKIILTSRETEDIETRPIPGFTKWTLLPFNPRQVQQFLAQWFSRDVAHERLLEALKDHELLDKLPNTPLVLTLLAILFDCDSGAEVPSNLSELYEMFTSLLVGRWNMDRRINTFFSANDKEYVLAEVAVTLHERRRYSVDRTEFAEIVSRCSERLGREIDADKMLRELVEQTCILVPNDRDQLEFRHLSFQEFFVAKRYLKRPTQEIEPVLTSRFIDDWWSQVVYYFCGLRKDNGPLLNSIFEQVAATKDDRVVAKSIWSYGYLVQSSYETEARQRQEMVLQNLRLYGPVVERLLESVKTGRLKTPLPPIHFLISMVYLFRIYYSSRYIASIYEGVFRDLLPLKEDSFGHRLALLILGSMLTELNGGDYLFDIYDQVRKDPILSLALDFELNMALDSGREARISKARLRKAIGKLRKQFISGRSLYKTFYALPKHRSSIDEVAASSSNDSAGDNEPQTSECAPRLLG